MAGIVEALQLADRIIAGLEWSDECPRACRIYGLSRHMDPPVHWHCPDCGCRWIEGDANTPEPHTAECEIGRYKALRALQAES
jgi:hypothetical protein